MTLTVVQQPDFIQPAFNPLNFVLSSTQSGAANFFYETTVYDEGSNLIAKFNHLPRPDGGRLWFDAHRVVESFTTFDIEGFKNKENTFKIASVFKYYRTDFVEYYGTPVASGDSKSIIRTGINAALSERDFYASVFDDWIVDKAAGTGRFLTDRTRIRIRQGETYELGLMTAVGIGVSDADHYRISYYNASGGLISSDVITNGIQGDAPLGRRFLKFFVMPPSPHPAGTAYYTVAIEDSTNDVLTDVITFVPYCEYERGEIVRLHYLNHYGRIDSMTFFAPAQFEYQNEKMEFNRIKGELLSGGYTYDSFKHSVVQYNTRILENITLNTGWINDEEMRAVVELVNSPAIWWEIEDEVLIPLNMVTSNIEKKYQARDKLFDAQIQVRISERNFSQRL